MGRSKGSNAIRRLLIIDKFRVLNDPSEVCGKLDTFFSGIALKLRSGLDSREVFI